jgi:pimeloyl-ACP methyl ester carboxylesterase
VLLHGNPTSSYLWRNVLPHLQPRGRCIAPDLIGMGDSDKLPHSGPGSYRFVEHRRYLDALLETLDVRDRVTFVIHDWGSALGFDWANRHRDAVKGIAYMEAIVVPQRWDHWDKFGMRAALQGLRSAAGEEMVLRDNFFIEQILPKAILRTLSAEEMAACRRGSDRSRLRGLARDKQCAQAVRQGRAWWDPRQRRGSQRRPQVPSADRGDGRGDPLRPGGLAGRNRAGHSRLDGDVGLTGACEATIVWPRRSSWF